MFLAYITSAGFSWQTSVGWNSHGQLLERDVVCGGRRRVQIPTGVGRVEGIMNKKMSAKMWRQSANSVKCGRVRESHNGK